MMGLKKIFGLGRAHLAGMRGNIKQNDKYCSKASTLSYFGDDFVEPGARRDVQALYASVRSGLTDIQLMEQDFALYGRFIKAIDRLRLLSKPTRVGFPDVYLLVGRPGCGKTRRAYEAYPDLWEPPINMSKQDTNWFDGYTGQKQVLLDEFEGHMPLNSLLKILDRYVRQVPVKGGFTWFNPDSIILTANEHPSTWYNYCSRLQKEQALRRRISHVAYFDDLNDDWIIIDNVLTEGDLATPAMKKWWPSVLDKKNINEFLMKK